MKGDLFGCWSLRIIIKGQCLNWSLIYQNLKCFQVRSCPDFWSPLSCRDGQEFLTPWAQEQQSSGRPETAVRFPWRSHALNNYRCTRFLKINPWQEKWCLVNMPVLLSQASASGRCSALHCSSTLGYSAAIASVCWLTAGSLVRVCQSRKDWWEGRMELKGETHSCYPTY